VMGKLGGVAVVVYRQVILAHLLECPDADVCVVTKREC
jgi:hypothetical protein